MVTNPSEDIRQHYETPGGNAAAVANVIQFLKGLGEGPLTAAQLAPLDQFHVRGLPATKELAEMAAIQQSMKVLDAGSGLGGPARYLAETYGCYVTGIDLTPSFVAIANLLAERTGLQALVKYEIGDLLALPFPDGQFDLVWTQHVVMNIRDRAQVYREFRRVLRPNGRLAFFDLFAPDERTELLFPVPWADNAADSFLLTKEETLAALHLAGFASGHWQDVTEQAQTALAALPAPTSSTDALSLATVMGPRFGPMLANLRENIRQGRVRIAMGCQGLSAA